MLETPNEMGLPAPTGRRFRKRYLYAKRVLDIVGALLGLVLFAPVFLIISIIIVATDGFPVFFRQTRVGADGQTFCIIKFRSMRKNAEEILRRDPALWEEFQKKFKLDNDPRITPIGEFLRRTSLDEIPQFWNVLKGEMSIVGPRPIVPAETAYYGEDLWAYTGVKPGCAGLWQCSGRSDTTYEERIKLDIEYYHTCGFFNDLKVLGKTLVAIARRDGAK